jgi:hypothetical protein
VADIREVLRKIGPMVGSAGGITADNVKSIHELTSGVDRQIVNGGN